MNGEVFSKVEEEQNTAEANDSEVSETAKSKSAGRFGKKQLGLIGVAVVIVIVLLIGIGIGNSPTGRLARQLELGQKYLEEMNYEEAIVVLNSVIEIDPMNVDAYLGLVEVYIRTGDFDTALAYAEKGYEATGDVRLKEKIDMIESGNITASNGWTMKTSYYDYEYGTGLVGYEILIRNLQGEITSKSLYDKTGNLIDTGEYQYDGNGNVVVGYGESFYSETSIGGLVDIGVRLIRTEYEYDEEGRRIAEKTYDSSGNLISDWKYEYDEEGREIGWKNYDVLGNLIEYHEYEYDSDGRKKVDKLCDASGNVVRYEKLEYNSDGRYIGRKEYDGSGNLISEEKNE